MTNKLTEASVDEFIEALAKPSGQLEKGKLFENMYADNNSVQRKNLALYLNTMIKLKPTILLLGEAPGYRGCGKTGIPFTDEFHLYDKSSNSGFGKRIGAGESYSKLHEERSIGLEQETSATIIWDALNEWKVPPLMWNAFPYHPYKNSDRKTNRTPTAKEVAFGWKYVESLLNLFGISDKSIYCLGATAQNALKANRPLIAHYIRHPSYGGKNACITQLAELRSETAHE